MSFHRSEIYTGKSTEWSPIQSLYNHTSDYKIRFVNHEYDYRPTSDDTKSTYQLIIKITIFEKHVQEIKILLMK